MPIESINHFNIIASAEVIVEVRRFYIDVIGLTEGPRPNFDFDGHWLYAGNAPILHLMVADSAHSCRNADHTGNLDHIALTATDLEVTEARFKGAELSYIRKEVPNFNIVQLFIQDPIGLNIELNFSASY